jgi:hypothetical protein
VLTTTRSVRNASISSGPSNPKLIEDAIDVAVQAPTGSNVQAGTSSS